MEQRPYFIEAQRLLQGGWDTIFDLPETANFSEKVANDLASGILALTIIRMLKEHDLIRIVYSRKHRIDSLRQGNVNEALIYYLTVIAERVGDFAKVSERFTGALKDELKKGRFDSI